MQQKIPQGEGNKIQIKYYETLCLDCPANISLVKCKASVPLICNSLVSKSRNRWGFGVTDQEAKLEIITCSHWSRSVQDIEIFSGLPTVRDRPNHKIMAKDLCGYLLNVFFIYIF